MKLTRSIRLLAFLVLIACVAFAIAYWLFSKNDVPINQSLYEQLALGMTAQEVDTAIGYAPGDYSGAYLYTTTEPLQEGELGPVLGTDKCDYANGRVSAPHPVTGRQIKGKLWRGRDGMLMVFFGEDNRVIERRFYPGYGRTWLLHFLDRLTR
jgi:hypothetical protein